MNSRLDQGLLQDGNGFYWGGTLLGTVKYHGFCTYPPSKISPWHFLPQGRKQQGAPPGRVMFFFWGGDPARTVKNHGFAPTPPQKFHRCIFSNQGRKQTRGSSRGLASAGKSAWSPDFPRGSEPEAAWIPCVTLQWRCLEIWMSHPSISSIVSAWCWVSSCLRFHRKSNHSLCHVCAQLRSKIHARLLGIDY